jgi:stress response protein SCP2
MTNMQKPLPIRKGMSVPLPIDKGVAPHVTTGLGWKPRPIGSGPAIDPDAIAIGLGPDGKVPLFSNGERDFGWFVYYGQPDSGDPNKSIHHMGDDRGEGDALGLDDSEQIRVNLELVPPDITEIVFAYYELGEDMSSEDAAVFGSLRRHGRIWQFVADSFALSGGIAALGQRYGVDLA